MPRALFEKNGNAVYISHLDLMRVFQRAFKRARLALTHTQGYSPRPSVSIALPLSVGIESHCELLDFDLDTAELVSNKQIVSRLNEALVSGVRVLDCYDNGYKLRDLAYLNARITLEYDRGVGNAENAIRTLLTSDSVVVCKRSKNGVTEQNIIPMIKSLEITKQDESTLVITALVCCQNPSLNPMQIVEAIRAHLPDDAPDFAKCCRMELYDEKNKIFR